MRKHISFLFLMVCVFMNSQITDTIFGKPKFVKEYVEFLNDSGPFTFMQGDDEYGHAVIMTPKNLRKRMEATWFHSDFCRYINNETYYDKERKIIEETWFYISGEIVDDYDYKYDDFGRLISEEVKNQYHQSQRNFYYDGSNEDFRIKESIYKWRDEPSERSVHNLESNKHFTIVKHDKETRSDSVFVLTNRYWKKVGERSYSQSLDSIYRPKLNIIRTYNEKYQIVKEHYFNYSDDYGNKVYDTENSLIFEYSDDGEVIKKSFFNKDKLTSYLIMKNGKEIEKANFKKESDSIRSKTINIYSDNNILQESSTFINGKLNSHRKYLFKNNYIQKLEYVDNWGMKGDEQNKHIINFKYKFDKHKNWTEITKNVDGKDLYVWKREIQYY